MKNKFRTMVDAAWDSLRQEDGPNMAHKLGSAKAFFLTMF